MPHLPLPGLTPDDPENRFSHEARQRIAAALLEYDRMRKQARSAIELRGYWGTPQAYIDMRQADMEGTRTVLRAEAEEYAKLALPAVEFREIMLTRIESMVYSLEFSNLQRDALEAEFVCATPQQTEDEPGPVERNEETAPAKLRVKAFMEQKALDVPAFAKRIGKSKRTVQSVLAGDHVGKETRVAVAKALGTTPEELFRK
jgi:hypothetical protein